MRLWLQKNAQSKYSINQAALDSDFSTTISSQWLDANRNKWPSSLNFNQQPLKSLLCSPALVAHTDVYVKCPLEGVFHTTIAPSPSGLG